MIELYEKMVKGLGMEILERGETATGLKTITAEKETPRGMIRIFCGNDGTARVDKPNGTHKWYYEKSTGQLRAHLMQIIEFYK